ncbi:MAG: M23 family metallopeptidase [Alphaproteobacteria bacterium]|nr:M23 family metallopeptidase [Alphaproteobacteria bacterium]
MISFSRPQLSGLCFLLIATGIAVHEYQSTPQIVSGVTQELITIQKDPSTPPNDLSELAEQISSPSESPQETQEKDSILQISSGDTMMSMLGKIGVPREEAVRAIEALKRVYDLRELKVGQEMNVRYRKDSTKNESTLLSLSLKSAHDKEIALAAEDGVFSAKQYQIALKKVQKRVMGTIDSSFYAAALKRGVPPQVVREAINALAYDINWQHDPTRGDPFTIVYDVYQDTNGNVVRSDNLKFVSFAPGGKNSGKNNVRRVYRFQPVKGTAGYYDPNGMNVVRTLLQTPMDPSKMRLTSKFGRRAWHPSGYSRNHKGVDFGAPIGTPVRAAGDGVIIKASTWGHYGNIIQIKHNKEYVTAYAHLSSMNVKVGQYVRQNQLIGKVGRTGRTTGPHLHYEVIHNGVHVNPQGLKLLPTTKLNQKDLAEFHRVKAQIEKEVAEIATSPSQVASVQTSTRTS